MAKNNKSNPFTEIKDRIKLYKKSNGQWVSSMTKLGITFATVATLSAVSIGVSADTTTPTADATQTTQTSGKQVTSDAGKSDVQNPQKENVQNDSAKTDAQTSNASQTATPQRETVKADAANNASTATPASQAVSTAKADNASTATSKTSKSADVKAEAQLATPQSTTAKSDNTNSASVATPASQATKNANFTEAPSVKTEDAASDATKQTDDTAKANDVKTDQTSQNETTKSDATSTTATQNVANNTNNQTTTDVKADDVATKTQAENVPVTNPVADTTTPATDSSTKTADSEEAKTDDATNVTPDESSKDLADRSITADTNNVDGNSSITPANQQTQQADSDSNANVRNLVLAAQGDSNQNYTYNAQTGDGTYGTAGFHYDQATGTLTFNGGGTLAQTDYKSNYWNEIGHDVKHIVFNGDVDAPVDSTYLFGASTVDYLPALDPTHAKHDYYSNLQSIEGLSHLKTGNVQVMNGMFSNYGHYSNTFRNLDPSFVKDIANFDTHNVRDFESMFQGDRITDSSAFKNWDMSSATDFTNMFYVNSLTNLNDFSNWNVANATDFSGMFDQNKLTNVDGISDWNMSKATSISRMFELNSGLTNVNSLGKWNTSNVTNFGSVFNMDGLTDDGVTGLANWNVSKGTTFSTMFQSDKLTTLVSFENWNVGNGIAFDGMFSNNQINDAGLAFVSKWDVHSGVRFNTMFTNNKIHNVTPLKTWNVGNGQYFKQMFEKNQIDSVDSLSDWNMSSATDVSGMFESNKLTNVDSLNGWKVDNVSKFYQMFSDNDLKTVNLSSWNTANGVWFQGMFEGNKSLLTLDISGWDMSNASSSMTSNLAGYVNVTGTGTYNFFGGVPSDSILAGTDNQLYIVKLGNKAKFFSDSNLYTPAHDQSIPDFRNHKATGKWQEQGSSQNVWDPNGTVWDGNYANLTAGTWTWQPERQQVNITYWDDSNNQQITVPAQDATAGGLVGDLTGWGSGNAQSVINNGTSYVEGLNYIKTSQDGVLPANYDSENPINITVHFKVATQDVEDHTSGTITIHYEYGNYDGDQAAPDKTVEIPFTRHGVKNLKTGDIQWDAWTTDNGENPDVTINSPQIKGYTPTQVFLPNNNTDTPDSTDGSKVTWLVEPDLDCDADVVYTANAEKAQVQYVDDVTGKVIDGSPVTDLNGKYGENIDQSSVDSEINSLKGQGYDYVTGKQTIPATFDFDGNVPMYTIHLTHSHSDVTDTTGKGTETVHYVYENGSKAADDKSVEVTFHRSGDKDNVTGEIKWSDWIADSDVDVTIDSSTIDGYTPNKSQVKTAIVEGQDNNDTVIYLANDEQVTAHYVDDENGNKIANDETINGKFGEDYATTAKEISGYHLVKVEGNANGKYTTNTPDVTYVYAKDAAKIVIHYVDNNGNTIHDDSAIDGHVGDDYNITPLEIDGYTYDHSDESLTGKLINEDGSVTLVYEKIAVPTPEPTPVTPQPEPDVPAPETPKLEPTPSPETPKVTPVVPKTETPASEVQAIPAPEVETPAPETPKAQPVEVQPEKAAPAAKAETPKKNALPQTGQDATGSLMSIIGAIMFSLMGLFGLDGFKKRKEDK